MLPRELLPERVDKRIVDFPVLPVVPALNAHAPQVVEVTSERVRKRTDEKKHCAHTNSFEGSHPGQRCPVRRYAESWVPTLLQCESRAK